MRTKKMKYLLLYTTPKNNYYNIDKKYECFPKRIDMNKFIEDMKAEHIDFLITAKLRLRRNYIGI